MSFNYLEIARAAELLNRHLPDEVLGVELVRFPLKGGAVPDINVALKLKNSRRNLVFSLKQPWTGVFVLPPQQFSPERAIWPTAFNSGEGQAQDWNAYIQSQVLTRAEVKTGDRVLTLFFENGTELRLELIPSRPNWVLTAGGVEFRWRSSLPMRPGGAMGAGLQVRDFGAPVGSDLEVWMQAAHAFYRKAREAALLQTLLARAAAQLQTRLTQLFKIRGQMEDQMAEVAKAEDLRASAEGVKARLHELPKGHKTGELTIYAAEGEKSVELDKKFTVADNVTRMFARFKKLARTKKEVEARLIGIEEESRAITSGIARVRGFKGETADFHQLARELGLEPAGDTPEGNKPKKADRKWSELERKSGVRKFVSKEGLSIWVGKNHKENEELVIRVAKGNDLWMHLKGRPGAHIIIQLPGSKSASLDSLLDGATLVAYYSGVSDKEKVEVDYTLRKFVKRVPGGGDKFLVTYTQNKTLMLKMEDERLWRLLKQH